MLSPRWKNGEGFCDFRFGFLIVFVFLFIGKELAIMVKKTEQLHVYLSAGELDVIKKKAKEFNLSLSAWAKLKLLDKI